MNNKSPKVGICRADSENDSDLGYSSLILLIYYDLKPHQPTDKSYS